MNPRRSSWLSTRRSAALMCVALLGCALASASAGQEARGEITGRITDLDGGTIPGVTVTVEAGNTRRRVTTDGTGQFGIRALPFGTYRARTELSGFAPRAGDITLSARVPRAHLAWTLEVGCLASHQLVQHRPREAAPLADAIVLARVVTANGGLLWSTRPDCEGTILQSYTVDVHGHVDLPGRSDNPAPRLDISLHRRMDLLTPGREYLAFLHKDGQAIYGLVLPVVDGRVPDAVADIGGMTVAEALTTLSRWAREKKGL